MKWGGLTEDEALALVTINPAKQLRIDTRVGSLEPGKDADVVVWNHHPLSAYAIVDRVYIDGTLYYDRLAEDKRLTALTREKADLVAAESSSRRTVPTSTEQRGRWPTAAAPQPDLAAAPRRRRRAAATDGMWAITNATIHPDRWPRHPSRHHRRSRKPNRGRRGGRAVPAGAKIVDGPAPTSIPDSSTRGRRWASTSPARAASRTSTRCSTTTRSFALAWRITQRATPIPVARANGITTVGGHAGRRDFGGEVAVMDLDGWTWEEATLRANAGIELQFPGRGAAVAVAAEVAAAARRRTLAPYDELKRERDRRLDELAHAVRPGPGLCESGSRQGRRLDARRAGAGRPEEASAGRHGEPGPGHPRRRRVRRPREGEPGHQRRREADRSPRS